MYINTIGNGDLTTQELTDTIMTEAIDGGIGTLVRTIKESELPPETVKDLLSSREGTTALVKAYKGEEDKAVFVVDTLEGEEREIFIETILYEMASSIKNSGINTTKETKEDSMDSTVEGVYTFLVSLISNMETNKLLEIIDFLGEDIFFALMARTKISIKENLKLKPIKENLELYPNYGDDETSLDYELSLEEKIESGMIISPNELEITGKYSEEITYLLETLFENEYSLYSRILENKVLIQYNYELGEYIETTHNEIKAIVKKYEKKYKDKEFKIKPEDISLLLEDKSPKKPKSQKVKSQVGITEDEVEEIIKEEIQGAEKDVYTEF